VGGGVPSLVSTARALCIFSAMFLLWRSSFTIDIIAETAEKRGIWQGVFLTKTRKEQPHFCEKQLLCGK
jgi:hypothetical protein